MARIARDVLPREAGDLPTLQPEQAITSPVAAKGLTGAVRSVAVRLDNRPAISPHEVDLHRLAGYGDPLVDARPGHAGVMAQRHEALLELAARKVLAEVAELEDPAEPANAGAARVAGHRLPDGDDVQQAEHIRLVARALEKPRLDHPGEVEQGARHRGAWDRPNRDAVDRWQAGEAMQPDAGHGSPGTPSKGHVDHGSHVREQAVKRRRGAVREDGPAPTRQHRRHPPPVERQIRTTHRVDGPTDAVKPAHGDASAHRFGSEPKRAQLVERDHAVLLLGEGQDLALPLRSAPSLVDFR